MSLDFYLEERYIKIKLSDLTCEEREEESFWRNITHNVAVMWRVAGCYDALYNSHGKKASEIIQSLTDALKDMTGNKKKYMAMNPPNG